MASKEPVRDSAEHNAYFPSEYSLGQYVAPTTDFDGAKGVPTVSSGPRKILTVLTDERYLPLQDDIYFSTGNHPVETLLPLMHLRAAGYETDVATFSVNLAKFELWAMPEKDDAVQQAWEELRPQFERPQTASARTATTPPCSSPAATVPPSTSRTARRWAACSPGPWRTSGP